MGSWMSPAVKLLRAGSESLIDGCCDQPRQFLGWHQLAEADAEMAVIRGYFPESSSAWVVFPDRNLRLDMHPIEQSGIFELKCPMKWLNAPSTRPHYLLGHMQQGKRLEQPDSYAFPPLLGELDLYLFGQGEHYQLYNKLGAQIREINGTSGVNFAIWAPGARQVQVIGSFNNWDGRRSLLHKHSTNGVWEVFIPNAKAGDHYKFRLTDIHGRIQDKCDPYGFFAEVPPRTASIVADLNQFEWNDNAWLQHRSEQSMQHQPMSIYELHLGSWQQTSDHEHGWMNYRDIAPKLVEYCQKMGFTHIELMPVSEHPYTGSWGYQTVGYFAATSRYGQPADLMYFVDYCHRHNLGVLIDWVPAHFPKDAHGLARFDGTALYEHADPRQGEHPDWNTLIFNYGRNEVRNFLIANALFWLEKYHIDGLRVDAVASMLYLDYSRQPGQWIPNRHGGNENLEAIDFLRKTNDQVHQRHPGVLMIAEESTAWPGVSQGTDRGGLGFDLKWNMGWMNDTLKYFKNDPIHRKFHHDTVTFSLIYAFSERFLLPFSHDEVVHGKGSLIDKMPGDAWRKFANLRLLYAYQWMHPGKKLMFMGSEFAQWREWNCNAGLDWHLLEKPVHQGVQSLVGQLNHLYCHESALYDLDFHGEGFQWIDCHNRAESSLAWRRRDREGNEILIVCNFTPVVRRNYRLGVPAAGTYREILNTDASEFGGSNVLNENELIADAVPHHGLKHSLQLTLPPLAAVILKIDAAIVANTGTESTNIEPGTR